MTTLEWMERYANAVTEYLPDMGEGETMATQIVTAVNRLVYKWFNDGDVFDNTGHLRGWANDLSDCGNWLWNYLPQVRNILENVWNCITESDYEDLLDELSAATLDLDVLGQYAAKPKRGCIYEADGPFEFGYWEDDDDLEEEEAW